ncbi:MAG TPA: VOC family protein [Candidatus Binatia bacterium]|nr:VOC family protein [Candidatus Binatia bacterium]
MKNARLLHYSHCVSDIERSRRFYVDVLGFEVVAEFDFDDEATARVMDVPGCKFKGIFMKRDGMRIEIIGFSSPPPDRARRPRRSNEVGHSHLSFYVTSLDETLAELRAKGVEVVDSTRAVLPSGIECCVVRDPDGFPIEIVQVPELTLLPYEGDWQG